jgi:23S rRNA pseudouridine2605 synthase
MAHPRYKVQKTYHVTLDRVISEGLLERIRLGIRLSDGMVRIDEIRYLSPDNHAALHIVLCSGRNRVIKRLFEQLGFWVKRLNRPYYAGLSTKGLAHGEWRYCTDREISALKKASGKRATCGNLTGL